jgi:ribosomal protein S18 acetylase RimI-like enzyme
VRVRRATPDDVEAITALASRSFTDAYAESSSEDDLARHVEAHFGLAAIASELEKPGNQYFVADDGGTLVGMIKLRAGELPEALPEPTAIEVQQLYVDTRSQRGGIGSSLMECAIETARVAGVGGVWLSVWTEAEWAVSFYRKCGFAALGELDFYLGETHYVDHLMWRPVNTSGD